MDCAPADVEISTLEPATKKKTSSTPVATCVDEVLEPTEEASTIAIEMAYDLVEQHLTLLSRGESPEQLIELKCCLARLWSAAGSTSPVANLRCVSLGVASWNAACQSSSGSNAQAPAREPAVECSESVGLRQRTPTQKHVLEVQLEKIAKDNDCLREQLVEAQQECETLRERTSESISRTTGPSALDDVSASTSSTQSQNQRDGKSSEASPTNRADFNAADVKDCLDAAGSKAAVGKGKSMSRGKAEAPSKGKGKGEAPIAPSKGKGKGKDKGKKVEPLKPKVHLNLEVKSLSWKRWQMGTELQAGTVWDRVGAHAAEDHLSLVPKGDLEIRFAKTGGTQKPEKLDRDDDVKKLKFEKLGSVAESDRLQREVALKTLPVQLNTPGKVIAAVLSMDSDLLAVDTAQMLHNCLCPSEEQESEMRVQRHAGEEKYAQLMESWQAAGCPQGKEPRPFQWDLVESFFEGMSALPATESRLSCWAFLGALPERLEHLRQGLNHFEAVVHCFRESEELPFFLGLVLAFGNTLNGGKNEQRLGRADGFHIEALSRQGFDAVNDSQGNNIRQMIFEVYFAKTPERANKFLEDLAPLFTNVKRRFGKKAGNPSFEKEVRIEIEEYEKSVAQLRGEWVKRNAELQRALQRIGTAGDDEFATRMPAAFECARVSLDELAGKKDMVKQQFHDLLNEFRAETYHDEHGVKQEMTSGVWCLLWDDFFVKGNLMLEHNERTQKDVLAPRFCRAEPLTIASLEMLWQLQKPVSLVDIAAKQQRADRRFGRRKTVA
jgi:hypothetical protein